MPLPRFSDSPEFRRLLAGDGPVHLARVALEIARDAYPGLEIESYLARIHELAERVRNRCWSGARVREILGQINWVLYVEEEMRGNEEDYYNPRNSYLNEVLDRRLGIPISLSVLYQAVAEPLGLLMTGLNLPAHFMLRVDDGERTWFVNPFEGGGVMTSRGVRAEALGAPPAAGLAHRCDDGPMPPGGGRHPDAAEPEGDLPQFG